ncbi:MAG: hypothetical protein JNK29_14115 [Anaerolineales bacterium]|nr:hypothetical protein [Anaerolineales bacterium]
MDELVKLVAAKAGLPEAQARTAVTTVLDFLKQKLPAPLAGQVEAAVSGGAAANVAGNVLKGVSAAMDQMKTKKG